MAQGGMRVLAENRQINLNDLYNLQFAIKHMSEYLRNLPAEYVQSCPILDSKYRLLFELGVGRFSKVKMGIEMASSRRVAIKIMNYKLESREINREEEQKRLQIFLNEVRLCLEAHHSSIIEIVDFNVDGICRCQDGKVSHVQYYVMKIADNGQLFQLMSMTDAFSEQMARHIFLQLLQILAHLHQRRIAHCDIKTDNVLVDQHMRLKLADFGYARYHADQLGNPIIYDSSQPVGTLKCNPPQTHQDKYHAEAVDLFAAGCLLFEIVVKAQPFLSAEPKDEHYHKLTHDRHHFWEIYAGKCNPSPDFKDLIEKLLCVNPLERMCLENVLAHPWLQKERVSEKEYRKEMALRIKKMIPRIRKNQQLEIKKACAEIRDKGKRQIRLEEIQVPSIAHTRHLDEKIQELRQMLLISTKENSSNSSSRSQDSDQSQPKAEKVQIHTVRKPMRQ